jgi:bile acid-coenzyme A ligase
MADHLVTYKCPSTYEFVDDPVRDEAGKVRRSLLAEQRTAS